jgi:hypothetical protein
MPSPRARVALAVVALALLGLAVLLAPAPASTGGGTLGALGASMGGMRVAFVDLLFLRAERLRREGRAREVPPLYEAIRDLDPGNVAAADHLAATYAPDLLAEALTPGERWYWWMRAWELLEKALADHPDDPSLLTRSSDLLLEIPARHPDIAARLDAFHPDGARLAFERLLVAARATSALPRRGRPHLLRLAVLVPVEAATRLAHGEDPEAILRLGDETLALRRPTLAEMFLPVADGPPGASDGPGVPLNVVLEAGLETVRGVRDALAAGDRARAEATLARYHGRVAEPTLVELLARLVAEEDG